LLALLLFWEEVVVFSGLEIVQEPLFLLVVARMAQSE
jgi:hypothetical protein